MGEAQIRKKRRVKKTSFFIFSICTYRKLSFEMKHGAKKRNLLKRISFWQVTHKNERDTP